MSAQAKLRLIKLAHTAVWIVMAGAIVALPWMGWTHHFRAALAVTLLIFFEGLILLANRGRCPLTDIAARYTAAREDNFDIYLPLFIARHNKVIFTLLFLMGEVVVGACWRAS